MIICVTMGCNSLMESSWLLSGEITENNAYSSPRIHQWPIVHQGEVEFYRPLLYPWFTVDSPMSMWSYCRHSQVLWLVSTKTLTRQLRFQYLLFVSWCFSQFPSHDAGAFSLTWTGAKSILCWVHRIKNCWDELDFQFPPYDNEGRVWESSHSSYK